MEAGVVRIWSAGPSIVVVCIRHPKSERVCLHCKVSIVDFAYS